jgi:phosphomevalonate kinase
MSDPSPKAVSAPGKVLIAGGYLVLDSKYDGLVFGLDARIHVHVQGKSNEIVVKSPQFKQAIWNYSYRHEESIGAVQVSQIRR